jgi:glycosyltransferase involved in cell wall biosynthesis
MNDSAPSRTQKAAAKAASEPTPVTNATEGRSVGANLTDPGGLKILCLTTSFPSNAEDPAGFFVYQLAEALRGRGADLTVVTPATSQAAASWPEGLAVHRFAYAPKPWQVLAQQPGGIPVALSRDRKTALLLPSFALALAGHTLHKAGRADVILANWAICGALAGLLRPLHGRPVITVLRGSDVQAAGRESAADRALLAAALRTSAAVVAVGEDLMAEVRQKARRPEKVHHIANGIHQDFVKVAPLKPGPVLNLFFAGFLIPRKGVDVLLSAAARIKDVPLSITLAGEGPLGGALREQAERLGLGPAVTFAGNITPGRPMAEAMGRAHCLVLPSHHEGRPNVALEAMAAGRPVIGSDIHGIRELVERSGAGVCFPDGDSEALAGVIRRLRQSPERLTEMGRQGRAWIIEQGLTWENAARRYLQLMAEAARRRA